MYENRKIFVFYDPPHLLKNVRNNLKKADLRIDEGVVSWQHIVDFYNFDKCQPIQMAPKLKDRHIELPPFSAMQVNLAAQVLSHSVAAGISALGTLKHLPDSAKDTAQFVEHFDGLFNTFNSQTVKTSQRLGHAFSDKSGHLSFLKESLEFLDKVKTSHCVELPCIFGWKLCIQSLLGLWEYLKTEQSSQFILTSQINQDCVENLFSIILGFGGHRDNPDVEQLKSSFKYVVADKLFVQSDASNCKVDNDKILLDVSNIAMAKYVWSVPTSVEKPTDVGIAVITPPPLSNATWNVAVYMAGYLLLKVPVSECDECSEQLILPRLPPPSQEMSFYTFVS